jgi:ACS family tartrate transporter-like MFS transporter
MLLSIFNYLDRVNVSFAKLQMNTDLGFSDAVYGFGASIFFVGYFLFELPSNLLLQRIGARIWIARIMISWGVVSTTMAFVKTPTTFYVLRFMLGVAEAGFFPAILLYFTDWIPARHRARTNAWFLTSLALSGIIGGPVAGALLGVEGFGLVGWQWLFLLEGIPTVLLGFVVLIVLPNGPNEASWLDAEERQSLINAIAEGHAAQGADAHLLRAGLLKPAVWTLALFYALLLFGFYAVNYWTPSIIKGVSHLSNSAVGWLSSLPFVAAIICMPIVGHIADRKEFQFRVIPVSLLFAAAGLFGAALSSSTGATITCLSIATVGIYCSLSPFWTVPAALLRGSAAATGIAVINSIGNLGGGLIGPNVIGQLRSRSDSYSEGLIVSASVLLVAAAFAFVLTSRLVRKHINPLPSKHP